jgi:hypothetical protein
MDWEWNPDIHLDVDINILMCIAKHSPEVWKLFSILNKELSKVFNPLSYEMRFREIVENEYYEIYYLDGKLHRTGGPARISARIPGKWVEWEWFKHDKLHRDNGPARYNIDGEEEWYENGVIHREGSPAYISPLSKGEGWFAYGEQHRLDGPAVMVADGYRAWFIRGKQYTEEEFHKAVALETFTNF